MEVRSICVVCLVKANNNWDVSCYQQTSIPQQLTSQVTEIFAQLAPGGVKMQGNVPVTSLYGLVVIFWLYFNPNFSQNFNYFRVGTSYLEYQISVNVKWKFTRYPIFLNLPISDISKLAISNRYDIRYLEKSRYLPISDISENRYAISEDNHTATNPKLAAL